MPYPLPPSLPEEGDFFSFCCTIPNAPAFKQAFLGMISFMEKWTAWERDAAHTGSIAARLWAAANDETRKDFYEGCQMTCDCPSLDDIRELLEEEMTIINNVSCCSGGGCGCGCADGYPDTQPDPEDPEQKDPPVPEEDENYDPADHTQTWHDALCGLAHAAVTDFQNLAEAFGQAAKNHDDYNTWQLILSGATLKALVPLGIPWLLYYALASQAGQWVAEWLGGRFWDAIEAQRNALACAVIASSTPADARAAWKAIIDQMPVSWGEKWWLKYLLNTTTLRGIYSASWSDLEQEDGRVCLCGDDDFTPFPEIEIPAECRWTYISQEEMRFYSPDDDLEPAEATYDEKTHKATIHANGWNSGSNDYRSVQFAADFSMRDMTGWQPIAMEVDFVEHDGGSMMLSIYGSPLGDMSFDAGNDTTPKTSIGFSYDGSGGEDCPTEQREEIMAQFDQAKYQNHNPWMAWGHLANNAANDSDVVVMVRVLLAPVDD